MAPPQSRAACSIWLSSSRVLPGVRQGPGLAFHDHSWALGEGEEGELSSSPLRNSPPSGFSRCDGASLLLTLPSWRQIGFPRCCGPVLLPLIKMLSNAVWSCGFLPYQGWVVSGLGSWERGRAARTQALGPLVSGSFCVLLFPMPSSPEEAQRRVPAFPEGSRKGWRDQSIGACRGTLACLGRGLEGTAASVFSSL